MMVSGSEWEDFGRIVMAVGLMALLAYLAPATITMSPAWARRMQIATIALISLALVLSLAATAVWFLR